MSVVKYLNMDDQTNIHNIIINNFYIFNVINSVFHNLISF